jgi:hypothetical protein
VTVLPENPSDLLRKCDRSASHHFPILVDIEGSNGEWDGIKGEYDEAKIE